MYLSLRTEIALASIFAANLVNWLLHGVLTVQLYLYYLAFPNDSTRTKAAVYTVYILETIQAIGLGIIQLLIIFDGSPFPTQFTLGSYLKNHEYKWAAQTLLARLVGSLVPLIAQCIYAYRIRIITQGTVIPCLVIGLATLQLFAAILTVITQVYTQCTIALVIWTVLNVVNDLIIAFVMIRSLSKEEPLSDYIRARVIRLIRLIIATGSLTVAANIFSLVSLLINAYVIRGWTGTPAVIFMPKVYANSILVMLNSRMRVRNSEDVRPLSISGLSTLVIADHRIGPSDSTMLRDEIASSTSATRPPI